MLVYQRVCEHNGMLGAGLCFPDFRENKAMNKRRDRRCTWICCIRRCCCRKTSERCLTFHVPLCDLNKISVRSQYFLIYIIYIYYNI